MNTIPPPPGILADDEFAAIQAAGGPQAAPPEDRDFMAAQVNQYKAFRISAPRVEDIEARTASRNFLDKLTLDPDNIAAANNIDLIAKAPPDQQAAIRDRLVVDSWLTDRLRSQTVITADGSTPAPELDPMRRDEWRDALAQELFGDNAPRGSDSALVAKLRERSDERRRHLRLLQGQDGTDDEAKAVSNASLARWASRSAYAGESMVSGFAKWKEQARKSPNWTPTADKATLFEKWADVYGETKAKAAPYQAAVRQTLDALKAITKERDDFGTPEQFDAAVAPLLKLDEQTLRTIALPTLRSMAELDTEPGGAASFWDQMGKSFMRVFGQGAAALGERASTITEAETARTMADPLAGSLAGLFMGNTDAGAQAYSQSVTRTEGENLVRTMLRNAITTDIDPIKPISTGPIGKRLEQMAYDVAGTAAYMTMLSVPYAGTAMATASFADDTTAMLLNKHPDMRADDARAIATIAAPIQTGIEQLQRLQVFGKVPVFNKAMNKLAGPGGNALARFGLYGATGTLVEYTEEKLQDAAPLAVQALASALKQDIPQANLDGFEAFELRTFLAVAPFALIGAGVNVSQDKAAMRQLVSDEAAMRAVGFSEDKIQTIQAAETTEAQTQAIRQAWETRDTTAPADERWQETVRKAGEEAQAAAVAQVADMAAAAGVQQVRRAPDGTTHVTLADGTVAIADNPLEAAAIIEGATDAAQGWDNVLPLTQMLDALDARPDAPTGAIDATFEERANVADLITRFTDIANDEAAPQDERTAAANYVQSLQQRAAIYEEQNPGQKVDWRKVTVAGQSDMQVREGVATAVIRVDKGASPYVVLEETVEADFKAMEESGEMTQADAVRELRDLERRTGDAYLSAWTGTNPAADRLAVVEGLSKAAQIYATGKARAGGEAGSRAAGVLREWRKAARGKLMQAEREGVAPKVIAYLRQKAEWLKAVIGQAIRMNRARREARDAGETFPLERFLQRVTGVAPQMQAAEEVTDAAAEVWDDEGLTYIPPEGDELTPFSFQPSPYSFSFVEEYGINHRPNDEGPRAFDLAENNLMPKDVYDHPEWYSAMEPKVIRETMAQLRKVKGKPDAELVIYRAGPVGEMNPGDWVSLSKEYARTHATSQDPETFRVWQAKVKAADVRWAMDDLAEFGYWGEPKPADDTGVSFSFQPSEPQRPRPMFSEDNRVTSLNPSGAMLRRIMDENPGFDPSAPTVKVYRAAIGKTLRDNDFVALRRSVAAAHLENLADRGEAGTVTQYTVNTADLLMGNDATEFVWYPKNAPAPSFSFQPTAILDDLAAKVESRMSRSPQARLDAVRAAVDNLAALKQAWQRRRDGAGISDERSKASIDAEADERQAFRAAELMQQAGISYATAREIVEGRRRAYEETLARETHARGVEDKTAQAIRREAGIRGVYKAQDLADEVELAWSNALKRGYRDYGFWDGKALQFLSSPVPGQKKGSYLARRGDIISHARKQKQEGKGEYVNPGPWNGSEELPRAIFRGNRTPDQAAQDLFSYDPGLFPPGTDENSVKPDMLWDIIRRELRENEEISKMWKQHAEELRQAKEQAKEWAEQWEAEYKANLEAARMAAEEAASAYVATATDGNEAAEKATAQAAKEAAAWKRKALTMQNQDWGSKETLVRAMRTLDAILSAFPAAVRGKVGGWLALARIGTQDRMAEEIDRRITILDRELERELRKDALEELAALRERAKPKREGGKKPTGKLGAEAHRFFERIEAVADLTADEVEAAGLVLETLAAKAKTPEEQADVYERQQILDQFGGLDSRDAAGVPLHDAQTLAAALAAAETVYETGRNQWRTQEEARLAEVQAMAQEVTAAVGAAPLSRILAQGDAAKKLSGMLKGGTVSLRSFREVLHLIMGRDNPLAKQWADRAMDAMHARTDELADIRRRWRGAMEAATGQKRHKAEARVWDMGTKRTVAVTVRPGKPVQDVIPIDAIPNLAGLGYNAAEIADAEAAFLALPADSRAKNITITRWQKDTEEAVSLTDAEAVYYSMLWRQEQYRENLNRAGLGQETQDEIEAGMSGAAKALREYIAGEYASGYYPLASLFRGMFGVDLPQIANYAPGKWWSRGVEKAMDPSGAGMVEGGFRAGMLKDRKAHLAEPKPENAFALWLGHVSQTAHWKAVAPLARELRGVFGHPEVKKAITARHGAETLDALTRWLDAIEANGVRTNFPAWAQTLLGWQANVKLAWKVGTILKQSTGLIAAAYRMPLKAYASGMRLLVTGQIDVRDIWESPMIQRRLESGFAPEVRSAMSRTFTDAPTLRRRFVQQGMELIGYADAFFATASAAIHYDWQLSQIREAVPGISDTAAKRHAMRETQLVVNATAQPVEITERSLVEMGGFGKVFLIFGSEARQKSSMWITAWGRVLRKQATEEDWRTLAIMHLVVGPVVQLISSAWMDARDDDDDEWFDEKNWKGWDFVRSMALGPMAGIPIVRDLTDGFSGDSGPTAQTAKAMQSAVKIVKGPGDSEDEAVEWYAQRTFEILKGADSFTAVAAGIGEQTFRIGDNLFATREEVQAQIDRLEYKKSREKDEGEREDLEARIKALKKRLE